MTDTITLYHNPRCSKSRDALALLEARQLPHQVVRYLDTPPDFAALKQLFQQLGLDSPRGMMRVKDELYQTLDLANPALDNDALLQAIADPRIMVPIEWFIGFEVSDRSPVFIELIG